MEWVVFASAFAASFVECVEAFTIVLVVGVTINWRSALAGTAAALLILAALVGVLVTMQAYVYPFTRLVHH